MTSTFAMSTHWHAVSEDGLGLRDSTIMASDDLWRYRTLQRPAIPISPRAFCSVHFE
jgi:hypothetical protein